MKSRLITWSDMEYKFATEFFGTVAKVKRMHRSVVFESPSFGFDSSRFATKTTFTEMCESVSPGFSVEPMVMQQANSSDCDS